MTCKCGSSRIAGVYAKCVDTCCFALPGEPLSEPDYAPPDIGLGKGGDYLDFKYCLKCGQIQGDWPIFVSSVWEERRVSDIGEALKEVRCGAEASLNERD